MLAFLIVGLASSQLVGKRGRSNLNSDVIKTRARHSICRVREWHNEILDAKWAPLFEGGEPNLMATCFAVLGAECSGALEDTDEQTKEEIATSINACQSKETGIFTCYPLKRTELSSHSATYIQMQATYFAIHALDALGAEAGYPIAFREKLKDAAYTEGWIDGGNWKSPWLHSNNIMFALTFLQTSNEFSQEVTSSNTKANSAFNHILDYLDKRQDPVSGLWQPDDGREDRNAVFAAYHFFPYYFFAGRPLQYEERIIDTLLKMIQPDGFFGYAVGRSGACEDLDVIHSLVLLASSNNYRCDDVRETLSKSLDALLSIQSIDGGFPNYLKISTSIKDLVKNPRVIRRYFNNKNHWQYSGWKRLTCPRGISDTWGSWFRPLSIRLISEYLSPDGSLELGGCYRRLPGLGWHVHSETSSLSEG